jgi:hypothetical protein
MSDEYNLRAGNIEYALEQFDGLEMVMKEDKENLDDLIVRLSEWILHSDPGYLAGSRTQRRF